MERLEIPTPLSDAHGRLTPFIRDGVIVVNDLAAAFEGSVSLSAPVTDDSAVAAYEYMLVGDYPAANPSGQRLPAYRELRPQWQEVRKKALIAYEIRSFLQGMIDEPTLDTYPILLRSTTRKRTDGTTWTNADDQRNLGPKTLADLVLPTNEDLRRGFQNFTGSPDELKRFGEATAAVMLEFPHLIPVRRNNWSKETLEIRSKLTSHCKQALGVQSAPEFRDRHAEFRAFTDEEDPEKLKAFAYLTKLGYASEYVVSDGQSFYKRLRLVGSIGFDIPTLQSMIDELSDVEKMQSMISKSKNMHELLDTIIYQAVDLLMQVDEKSPFAGKIAEKIRELRREQLSIVPHVMQLSNLLGRQLVQRGDLPEGVVVEELSIRDTRNLPAAIDRLAFVGLLDTEQIDEETREKYILSFRYLSLLTEFLVNRETKPRGLTIGEFILAHPELTGEQIADAVNNPKQLRRQGRMLHRPSSHAYYNRHRPGYGIIS